MKKIGEATIRTPTFTEEKAVWGDVWKGSGSVDLWGKAKISVTKGIYRKMTGPGSVSGSLIEKFNDDHEGTGSQLNGYDIEMRDRRKDPKHDAAATRYELYIPRPANKMNPALEIIDGYLGEIQDHIQGDRTKSLSINITCDDFQTVINHEISKVM